MFITERGGVSCFFVLKTGCSVYKHESALYNFQLFHRLLPFCRLFFPPTLERGEQQENLSEISMSNDIVRELKDGGEDFEWYPTTKEMIDRIKEDMKTLPRRSEGFSILDCGAGDGRVLNALGVGRTFAIEKSSIMLRKLKDHIIMGTDFNSTSLIDKKMNIIFSNPPYSEYENWMGRIITDSSCTVAYLIVPRRWKESAKIQEAIDYRKRVDISTLGSYDFLEADRKARAKVDIVKLEFAEGSVTSFDLWFDKEFYPKGEGKEEKRKEKATKKGEMVEGGNLVKNLENLYNKELETYRENYRIICNLNPEIMESVGVLPLKVKESLMLHLDGLKVTYWNLFISNYSKINERLTSGSLKEIKSKLLRSMKIDFNSANMYAITGWILENANDYLDSQIIDTIEKLYSIKNIKPYKSNIKLFEEEKYKYTSSYQIRNSELKGLKLENRCIVSWTYSSLGYSRGWENERYSGLNSNIFNLINDLLIVSKSMGFLPASNVSESENWNDNPNQTFYDEDGSAIMSCKVFKNGNVHIKFNSLLMLRINLELGRLKGWVKSKPEAQEEMELSESEIEEYVEGGRNYKFSGVEFLEIGNED